MDVKNLPKGTILKSAGSEDRWSVFLGTPALEGATCYRIDFIGSRTPHTIIAYSYEIGPGKPFQVVV